MRARDILRDRVALVMERDRYRKALRQIVSIKDDRDTEERSARELSDAIHIAESALAKTRAVVPVTEGEDR